MTCHVDVDKVGRMVLPKAIRERYGIPYGGRMEVIDTGQGVLLKPEATAPVVTHLSNGFPVLHGSGTVSPPDITDLPTLIARTRAERDARNLMTDTDRP